MKLATVRRYSCACGSPRAESYRDRSGCADDLHVTAWTWCVVRRGQHHHAGTRRRFIYDPNVCRPTISFCLRCLFNQASTCPARTLSQRAARAVQHGLPLDLVQAAFLLYSSHAHAPGTLLRTRSRMGCMYHLRMCRSVQKRLGSPIATAEHKAQISHLAGHGTIFSPVRVGSWRDDARVLGVCRKVAAFDFFIAISARFPWRVKVKAVAVRPLNFRPSAAGSLQRRGARVLTMVPSLPFVVNDGHRIAPTFPVEWWGVMVRVGKDHLWPETPAIHKPVRLRASSQKDLRDNEPFGRLAGPLYASSFLSGFFSLNFGNSASNSCPERSAYRGHLRVLRPLGQPGGQRACRGTPKKTPNS